ncbi:Crp/Fnr family transcriptional regulator [Paracoccus homiensis]|uniref:cAMP-binding domain of CRP or a regulatory subunit of cAMP-dependent protein kinases n=1 Tax=Paracoccus homiensis TaxID=364199 RepID=A0A1I0ABD9_9RHOB|nr:Crp/Fnr family transcriptional regulator [Paracoccus homiensis]SES91539.1 cAMP-binding domain of CRP or a regulatory subunit of cAMP-dependent protein kinases [Paracoccus homiensis]
MAISEYFIRYLQRRDTLSDVDLNRLRKVQTQRVSFGPGEVIVPEDRIARRSCMMLRGMSARAHQLVGRPTDRVITALHVPGDFVDLHGFVLAGLEHSVISVGPSEVEFIDHAEMTEITENFPHLTRLLWMATLIDAAIHRQWLVAAASLRSSAHLAHLICEIYTRLNAVGAASDYRFCMPLLQRELAEILGYSPIHVNRAVRDLRDRGALRWNGSDVQILDWAALVRLARFDPTYLDLEQLRR